MQQRFRKLEIIGAVVVSLCASLFHFTYAFSGNILVVGLISAVNESVWEHTKIVYFPFLFYSIIEYFILKPNFKRFFAAKAVSLAFITIVMISFFYTYTGMFGIESLAVDIAFTFILVILAFVISTKLYHSGYRLERYFPLFCILFFGQLAMQLLFTPFPPQIPLFKDSVTGLFGFPPK